MLKTTQLSLLNVSLFLFLLEFVLYATLLMPSPETLRMIISIPFVFVIPGCLVLLSARKGSVDIVEFLLIGFVISIVLGAGVSLLIGAFLKGMNHVLFMSILIAVSLTSTVSVWIRKGSRENFVLTNKHTVTAIALAAGCFASLMLFYEYKSPIPVSDGARYFFAAQNYIKSFVFSPYPPFPLQSWEIGVADVGGAISFRNLWVIIMALQTLVAQSVSITVIRTLNIFLTSLFVLVTFHIGRLVGGRKLAVLAALFTALNPLVIFFAPYEVPYISAVLVGLIAYSLYLSAVGGKEKNFRLAFMSLYVFPLAFLLHITVVFFWILLILHFLFVVLKHGGKRIKSFYVSSVIAFGLLTFLLSERYLTGSRFQQFVNVDLEVSVKTVYNVFFIPLYFTIPIWILFMAGILLTFVYKRHKSIWGLNLYTTLSAILTFLTIFTVFRYGVSFRFFLILLPLITIIAVYGFLEDVRISKRDLFFLGILYFVLILYLANRYPYTVIFPFGRVTLDEVYLTFLPAVVVLAWKVLWKKAYGKRMLTIGKAKLSVRKAVLYVFILLVSATLISEVVVYVANPWLSGYLNPAENGLKEAGEWINNNVEPGSVLVTNAWNYLGLHVNHTRTPIVLFPAVESFLLRWISEGKVDYLVIFTNLKAPQVVTRFYMYGYLKKYSDTNQSAPSGTTEYYRDENFVVYKSLYSYGFSPIGVTSNPFNNEIWSQENGYIQLNMTRSAVFLSYRQAADYVPISKLDFENTNVMIDNSSSVKLGIWDRIEWLNYENNGWKEWTETSQPPQVTPYFQQTKTRLSWNKGTFSLFMYITLERGRLYGQMRWEVPFLGNNTITLFPSIKLVEKLNRAYIPSSQPTEWSKHSKERGNPGLEEMFGLGFLLSRTPNVKLAKGEYIDQRLPSSVLLPEKTKSGEIPIFTYTFDVVNEAETDQWTLIEAYVPDSLVDQDQDGFYNAGLQSYNVNDGRWWDFTRWDSKDVGSDGASIGPWANTATATLLNGTTLSIALGYDSGYMQGVGLYNMGEQNETVNRIAGVDAPENVTYANNHGILKRLGFAIRIPGKKGEGSNRLSLRLYLAYNEATYITYVFSNSSDTHYGFGSINNPFIWLYNSDEPKSSMGLVFNKMPSSVNLTVDTQFNYTNLRLGCSLSKKSVESPLFYMNLVSIDDWPWDDLAGNGIPDTFEESRGNTAFSAVLSSLAYYNFTIERSSDLITMTFGKSAIENDFNVEPLFTVAIDEKWTWVSGGAYPHSLMDKDQIFDVSDASAITYKIQPKAIVRGVLVKEQAYDAAERKLSIQLTSEYASEEIYGTLIVYMLKRILVFCGELKPTQVYVDSEQHVWHYDEASNMLKVTLTELAEVEINVFLTQP